MIELDLTVTNSATAIASILAAGQNVPQTSQYAAIHNPHATASIAFTLAGTPAVNGKGITLGPLGSMVFDAPPGCTIPIGSLTLISSASSQAVTVFCM